MGGLQPTSKSHPGLRRRVHRSIFMPQFTLRSWQRSGEYNLIVEDTDVVLQDIIFSSAYSATENIHAFIRAGPRNEIVFEAAQVHAAIVTCGGICPGINNVIREIVKTLWMNYGVRKISGIRNGYRGFFEEYCQPPMPLTPHSVQDIHNVGGTVLGSTRGGFNLDRIMQSIITHGYNIIFCIGGDGTMRGAFAMYEEARKRGLPVVVANVPKTVDNDVPFLDSTFGFPTAVGEAQHAIKCATVEARCCPNGLVIVQLMGRAAGFIAMNAALASADADLVLIPEVQFEMHGANGICAHLKRRIEQQGHAVIVTAEGAGQHLLPATGRFDESGNPILPEVGLWLKGELAAYFKSEHMNVPIRFIDPSYLVRSVPASSHDAVHCMLLSTQVVHGAMAGLTGFTVGLLNDRTVYLPMDVITAAPPKRVNVRGRMWDRTVMMTRQPRYAEDNADPASPRSITHRHL
eukprot:TRINITY_DN1067_c0_g1_i2.p1 TRINITY_DN1067_c0_g1~~TRINITY_DN1067_c0_g1_i2.p1  ORF type:complete len:461 (-),score=81.53 TRINITY_DN1067_c0_g1_i2:37-1419(-)